MAATPRNFQQIALLIFALFAIHLLNVALGMSLIQFGIIPRYFVGLRGILFSPLLHGSWGHLLANAGPLAVMLALLSLNTRYPLWPTTWQIWLFTGAATWLVGRPGSVQVGASGLIYGLAAFLITAALVNRDVVSALTALLVIAVYGGIIWGVLPLTPGVSWEGHLCGVFAGIVVARDSGGKPRRKVK